MIFAIGTLKHAPKHYFKNLRRGILMGNSLNEVISEVLHIVCHFHP